MSGVYIKGMEMPTNCYKCDMRRRDGMDIVCPIAHERFSVADVNILEYRLKNCPLVPVPPHGLIAREQILDAIRLELAQANACNDMDDYEAWVRVFDYVRKFPTIIPASGGRDGEG